MKLQQLRYLVEIVQQDLNISAAAEKLNTAQPGISKQIKQLEDELGLDLFVRNGKHLAALTVAGEEILGMARRCLQNASNIERLASEFRSSSQGQLTIATTHTQARYALPGTVSKFRQSYPEVSLHLNQGSPPQIAELAANGTADFAIATEAMEHFDELVMLPCYHWNRCILVPPDHPLCQLDHVSLSDVANHPIVTYTFGFTGRSLLDKAFIMQGLKPQVVLTAVDADVIKTYVRLGLGVGIVANMAYDATADADLVALDASHLFDRSTTHLGFRQGSVLRSFMYAFAEHFAPHLQQEAIDEIASLRTRDARQRLIAKRFQHLPKH